MINDVLSTIKNLLVGNCCNTMLYSILNVAKKCFFVEFLVRRCKLGIGIFLYRFCFAV